MIIAKIGSQDYKLDSLEDAENLLRILSPGNEIETTFIGRDMYYSVIERPSDISISISPRELLSPQELQQLREEKK